MDRMSLGVDSKASEWERVKILIAIVSGVFRWPVCWSWSALSEVQSKKVQHFWEGVFFPSGVVARGDKNKAILW